MEGPASPGLLRPSRDLSHPIPQYDMSDAGPATITIARPGYVFSPIDDPFDGVDPLSTSAVPPIPAPPGFAPIGQPRSLATPSVIMDTLPRDFPPPGSSVSLFTSGLLSPGQVQPVVDESGVVRCPSSPCVFIPAIDFPVVSVLTGNLSPPVPSVTGRWFVSGCVVEWSVESSLVVTGFDAVGRVLL